MESPQWLSDILELAELLLRLNQDDEADADKVLEDLEKGAITLHYALKKLFQLH